MRIKKTKDGYKLICSCCDLPFATVENGRLVSQSRHGHKSHSNALTVADLEQLISIMRQIEKGSELTESLSVDVVQ